MAATSDVTRSPAPAPAERPRRGSARGVVVLVLALLGTVALSLFVGSNGLSPGEVVDQLLRPDGSTETTIVRELRGSRTALGVAVGACLGVAGALMQGHTRNPLADPGLLGVNAGAALAIVIGIYSLGIDDAINYAWFGFAGAGIAATLVFAIGTTRTGPDPVTLVLAGTAVSALLAALTQAVVLNDLDVLDEYRVWVVGSVDGPGYDVLLQVAPFMVLGLLLAGVGCPGLNLLQLGDDVARSLGMNPLVHKATGIAAVMLLAGAATAAVGPVGFVGLVVPHVARFFGGVDYRWVVPYAALIGALLVVLADIVGRIIIYPSELQVGIVMALVGGPVFILLVRRVRLVKL